MAISLDSEDLEYVYHRRRFYADLDLLHYIFDFGHKHVFKVLIIVITN